MKTISFLVFALVSSFSCAAPPDYSAMLSAIDARTLIVAILSVVGLLGSVLVIISGGMFILELIGNYRMYRDYWNGEGEFTNDWEGFGD